MVIFIAVWVVFVAAVFWALACNNKCSSQRLRLIDDVAAAVRASDYRKSYWFVIDAVPYEKHLWRLFTFRDPWAIYPPELADVRKPGA